MALTDPATLPDVYFSDEGPVRHLHLDSIWIQGSMKLDAPLELVHQYIQRMMAWLLFVEPGSVARRRAMQLGLGAGSLTKFCSKVLRMQTTAIEINPKVLVACRGWFKLLTFGLVVPLLHGVLGVLLAHACGLSVGGVAVFGAMLSSASYIAAPAAVRAGLPEADVGRCITAALGIMQLGAPVESQVCTHQSQHARGGRLGLKPRQHGRVLAGLT